MTAAGEREKVAVVLSGGGANGAYEVGVLKALLSGRCPVTGGRPLEPDIFTGTSIGSFNAAVLVSHWDEYGPAAVSNLETLWLERLAGGYHDNGVFRIRGNPLEFLDPASYLPNPLRPLRRLAEDAVVLLWQGLNRGAHLLTASGEPLEKRLLELIDLTPFISLEPLEATLAEIDYQAIRRSSRRVQVAATNWATGELKVFANHEFTDAFGPIALRASTAVPGVFPPAEYGAHPFVDGSVLLHTPLAPAIRAGAEILHVVYLDPEVRNIPMAHLSNLQATFHRVFQVSWAAAFNDDVADAARINRGLVALDKAHERFQPDEETAALLHDVAQFERPRIGPRRLRRLTIHRFHPHDPLAGNLSLLNFSHDRIQALIERGFQDAVHHDPAVARDILPEEQPQADR